MRSDHVALREHDSACVRVTPWGQAPRCDTGSATLMLRVVESPDREFSLVQEHEQGRELFAEVLGPHSHLVGDIDACCFDYTFDMPDHIRKCCRKLRADGCSVEYFGQPPRVGVGDGLAIAGIVSAGPRLRWRQVVWPFSPARLPAVTFGEGQEDGPMPAADADGCSCVVDQIKCHFSPCVLS